MTARWRSALTVCAGPARHVVLPGVVASVAVIVLVLLKTRPAAPPVVQPAAAATAAAVQGADIRLPVGCTTVALPFAAGAALTSVAAAVRPADALRGIFRYDAGAGRFHAYAPGAPVSASDYTTVGAANDPAFICVAVPAVFVYPVAFDIALLPGTILAAPATAARGETVEIQVATGANLACIGGVNIPVPGSTTRFVPIEAAAGPSGVAVARFQTLTTDARGVARFAVRCANGQVARADITLT